MPNSSYTDVKLKALHINHCNSGEHLSNSPMCHLILVQGTKQIIHLIKFHNIVLLVQVGLCTFQNIHSDIIIIRKSHRFFSYRTLKFFRVELKTPPEKSCLQSDVICSILEVNSNLIRRIMLYSKLTTIVFHISHIVPKIIFAFLFNFIVLIFPR